MNKIIKCTDRMISLSNIESMVMLPREIINHGVNSYAFFQKGDFKPKRMFRKREVYDTNTYVFCFGYYTYLYTAKELFEAVSQGEANMNGFFDSPKQAEYDAKNDCLVRKPTIFIRTKSGDNLCAVFDTGSEANKIIDDFYSCVCP